MICYLPAVVEMTRVLATDTQRRRRRVRADLRVVVALRNGDKQQARVVDLSIGGMQLEAARAPGYGESVTIVVQLHDSHDWFIIPATVRWFSRGGFGVAFEGLDRSQELALAAFVNQSAA